MLYVNWPLHYTLTVRGCSSHRGLPLHGGLPRRLPLGFLPRVSQGSVSQQSLRLLKSINKHGWNLIVELKFVSHDILVADAGFPRGRGRSPENCMKTKEFGLGEEIPGAILRSATVEYDKWIRVPHNNCTGSLLQRAHGCICFITKHWLSYDTRLQSAK